MFMMMMMMMMIRGFFLSDPAKYTAIGDLYPVETLQGRSTFRHGLHIHPLYDRCLM